MNNIMNFQLGWFNKERTLFAAGVVFLLFGLYSFLFVKGETKKPIEIVRFASSGDIYAEPLPVYKSEMMKKFGWDTHKRELFVMLDAPQLKLPAPDLPSAEILLIPPPPYPQPSAKSNEKGGK